jgi:flagellar hook protein FlgE
MNTAQRAFQANAQVITTANQESQTIINIGH